MPDPTPRTRAQVRAATRAQARAATRAQVRAARHQIAARHDLECTILALLAECYPQAVSLDLLHFGVHWDRRQGRRASLASVDRRRVQCAVLLLVLLGEVEDVTPADAKDDADVTATGVRHLLVGGAYRWKPPTGDQDPADRRP